MQNNSGKTHNIYELYKDHYNRIRYSDESYGYSPKIILPRENTSLASNSQPQSPNVLIPSNEMKPRSWRDLPPLNLPNTTTSLPNTTSSPRSFPSLVINSASSVINPENFQHQSKKMRLNNSQPQQTQQHPSNSVTPPWTQQLVSSKYKQTYAEVLVKNISKTPQR